MNKGFKAAVILLAILSLVLPLANAVATTGHIKLLAVYEEDNVFKGSPADVQLEIKKGTGRVFLETIPLSKVDTQISTRFAKEMACKLTEEDCSKYDFFYTIKSPAGIVGGPSAGSAISVITLAMLNDLEIDQDAAMTGTINSGGLVGPVGSLKEKIDAAKEAGITKVIIPAVQAATKEKNMSIVEYGNEQGVEVVPAATLSDALQYLTGMSIAKQDKEIEVPQGYTKLMEEVSKELCDRSLELIDEINVFNLTGKKKINFDWVNRQKAIQNSTDQGMTAYNEGRTYSAASYCFGANVNAHSLLYEMKNLSTDEKKEEAKQLLDKINNFEKLTDEKKKETITDLQTYMIVKERILEAKENLLTQGNTSNSLGYVNERLASAVAWSKFFGNGGEKYNINNESLKQSCSEILRDTEERFQYLNLFFPGLLTDLQKNLVTSNQYYLKGDYALCIYLASRTKAEANIIVTMLGVSEDVTNEVLDQKILAAKNAIVDQIDSGIFPIIAYSYYEYSTSLKQDNKEAALLYSEYALELSDIDIYFEKKKDTMNIDTEALRQKVKEYLPTFIFIWGLVLGFILGWIVIKDRKSGSTHKKPARQETKLRPIGRTRLRLR